MHGWIVFPTIPNDKRMQENMTAGNLFKTELISFSSFAAFSLDQPYGIELGSEKWSSSQQINQHVEFFVVFTFFFSSFFMSLRILNLGNPHFNVVKSSSIQLALQNELYSLTVWLLIISTRFFFHEHKKFSMNRKIDKEFGQHSAWNRFHYIQ